MNIPNSVFLYINIGIVAIYLLFIFLGFKKGFLYEIVSIIYTIISIFVSYLLSPIFAKKFPLIHIEDIYENGALLSKVFDINSLINSVIYFIVIFLVLKLVYIVLTLVLKSFNKIPVLGKINRILGGLFGLINGTIVVLLISLILYIPVFSNAEEVRNGTLLKYIDKYSEKLINIVLDKIDFDEASKVFNMFDSENARSDIEMWINDHTNE